jgi:hypothetical protein
MGGPLAPGRTLGGRTLGGLAGGDDFRRMTVDEYSPFAMRASA